MVIYPAIDIKDGKCVMLSQGEFDREKIYYEDPRQVAKMWEKKGAQILHIIDLDGALVGRAKNLSIIEGIIGAIDIPIQLGGGIRDLRALDNLINIGVDRVILGTKALENREDLKRAVDNYGDRIVVAIDARDGYVAIKGWTQTSQIPALDFALEMEDVGVETIIYTDIARDGMLRGPNFEAIEQMKRHVNINLIASGGVSTVGDVERLRQIGVEGAIIGKALYEGKINLEDLGVG